MPPVTIYATRADLANYGAAGSAVSVMDVGKQDQAIVAACGKVDGYLRSQFTLPLLSAGGDLVEPTVSIACYWLMTNDGYNPAAGADTSIRDRYLDAIKWLEKVAMGTVTPDVVDSSTDPAASGRPRVITSSQRGWSSRGDSGNGGNPFQGD